MEIVKPGIEYRLHNFKSETEYQTVRFTEKTAVGFNPGTTNEEVVSMLIDRLKVLLKIVRRHKNRAKKDAQGARQPKTFPSEA